MSIEIIRQHLDKPDSIMLFCLMCNEALIDPIYSKELDQWLSGEKSTVFLRDVLALQFKKHPMMQQMNAITKIQHPYIAHNCHFDNAWMELDTIKYKYL